MKGLIRQCFVQFRSQLIEEKLIDQEAIFIDGTKIEANANKFTFVWKKSIEKYHQSLIEKSSQLYNELLENEIIPEIERESDEQLSLKELTQLVQKVDDVVTEYDQQIEASDVAKRICKIEAFRRENECHLSKTQNRCGTSFWILEG